ncbi:hypothetical protein BH23GEM9_BH23GEM9_10710 [soil metagenome]
MSEQIGKTEVTRFLPAAAAVYLVNLTGMAILDPGAVTLRTLESAGVQVALLTAGFSIVVRLAAPMFRQDSTLSRKAVIAGLASPLVLAGLSVFTQGATLPSIAVFSVAAGCLTGTAAMAAAWLRRRRNPPLDADVQRELERIEAELATYGSLAPGVADMSMASRGEDRLKAR